MTYHGTLLASYYVSGCYGFALVHSIPRYIRYVLLVVRTMFFLSVMGLCIVACAAVATTKPASRSDKDGAASGPVVLLTTEKLLKASQPHSVSNAGEDTFLIQVIRCRSRDANSSKVTVNTTVEMLPMDDELESSLTSLNITVKPSNVSNHTFYVEGRFVWSSNSESVEPTAPPDYKWVVRMRCIDSSAEETIYSEPVKEVLMASQGSRSVNVPREHAANPLNLLPGTVVLPLQVCMCCMYVRTYVCMYVCMYVCVRMYVCMYAHMYLCMYICT